MFQRDLALYESQMKALEMLVEPLKGEYLRRLVGNTLYRKLVLLEGLRPNIVNMKRKRASEERSDDRKRAKTSGEPEALRDTGPEQVCCVKGPLCWTFVRCRSTQHRYFWIFRAARQLWLSIGAASGGAKLGVGNRNSSYISGDVHFRQDS